MNFAPWYVPGVLFILVEIHSYGEKKKKSSGRKEYSSGKKKISSERKKNSSGKKKCLDRRMTGYSRALYTSARVLIRERTPPQGRSVREGGQTRAGPVRVCPVPDEGAGAPSRSRAQVARA